MNLNAALSTENGGALGRGRGIELGGALEKGPSFDATMNLPTQEAAAMI